MRIKGRRADAESIEQATIISLSLSLSLSLEPPLTTKRVVAPRRVPLLFPSPSSLEGRNLIKPVKSYSQKSKKLYMLSSLEPSPSLTGGPWYTEHEFDHSFILELRNFALLYVRKNFQRGGKPTTSR